MAGSLASNVATKVSWMVQGLSCNKIVNLYLPLVSSIEGNLFFSWPIFTVAPSESSQAITGIKTSQMMMSL